METDKLLFSVIVGGLFLYLLMALLRSIRLIPAQTEYIQERFGKLIGLYKAIRVPPLGNPGPVLSKNLSETPKIRESRH